MADNVKKKLRMIWNSNSVFSTSGYGVHMRDLLYRFVKEGYNTAQIAYYGLEGAKIEIEGLKIYPKMAHLWGSDAMIHHSKDFKANVVFTMMDIWVLDPGLLKALKIPWIPYLPIDHLPPPDGVLANLKYANRIITFSEFGRDQLQKHGFYSTLIPEGTNTKTFRPMNQMKARKALGIPQDIFLFGMVGANKDNPPRKGFQQALDAFKMFYKKHPRSGIFIHTLMNIPTGFPITRYARYLGIEKALYYIPDYNVLFSSDQNVISQEMNTFDILLQPSHSEGFGLPIIEAQSCGKPVLVTDWNSMPELIVPGETGDTIKLLYKRWSALQGYWGVPDHRDLYDKMEKWFHLLRMKTGIVSKLAREHILKNYDNRVIFKEKWIPYMAKLEKDIFQKPKK